MLKIEDAAKSAMIADAIKTFPNECCGFMFGHEDALLRTITTSLEVNNAKEGDQRRRFEISAIDYMQAEKYAEENNLLLLGIYHSHPNHPAIPSEHDRIAAQTYFSYVIISVIERKFSSILSWQLNDSAQFEEEKIN